MEEISIEPEYGETEQIIKYKPIIIEQNNIRYILDIEKNQDKIIFSINNKEEFPSINYIKTMNFKEIKELNKAFSVLNSFNNFYDYIQTLSDNNKINIKYNKDKITILLNIELSKQQEIDLYPNKIDINVNIKEIYQEIFNIKEKIKEIDSLKEECISLKRKIAENTKEIFELKNENEYLRKKLEDINKDNTIIKSNKEEIIKNKDENIKIIFENKLYDIFSDKKKEIHEISDKDIKELKKLGSALLIKHKESPLDVYKLFMDTNLNNNKDKNEVSKYNNELKKGKILIEMCDILDRKLDINNPTKYLRDFREKYGIDDNEISDKIITKYMKKYDNDEEKIIEAILKKLKYIK